MQIVSTGDNLHEMSNPVFWKKKKKKYFSMSSAENFTQNAKHLLDQVYLAESIYWQSLQVRQLLMKPARLLLK